MIRTSQDFYNYFMMVTNFFLAISQLLVYLTNYPNELLKIESNELFQLHSPERYTTELSLGFAGFFLIMSIVFVVLRTEGNNSLGKDRYGIVGTYIIQTCLMIYIDYFPLGTFLLLGLTTMFGLLAKPIPSNGM